VRLLGYVATTYAKRNISLVRKDIETYAAWPTKSSNPALAVRGIFFDETPQQYDADALAYLEDLTEVVKNTEGFGPDPLVSPCLSCMTVTVCIAVFYVLPSRPVFPSWPLSSFSLHAVHPVPVWLFVAPVWDPVELLNLNFRFVATW